MTRGLIALIAVLAAVLLPNAHAGAEDLPAPDMRVMSALTLLDASPATSELRAVIDANRVAVHFVPMTESGPFGPPRVRVVRERIDNASDRAEQTDALTRLVSVS